MVEIEGFKASLPQMAVKLEVGCKDGQIFLGGRSGILNQFSTGYIFFIEEMNLISKNASNSFSI